MFSNTDHYQQRSCLCKICKMHTIFQLFKKTIFSPSNLYKKNLKYIRYTVNEYINLLYHYFFLFYMIYNVLYH